MRIKKQRPEVCNAEESEGTTSARTTTSPEIHEPYGFSLGDPGSHSAGRGPSIRLALCVVREVQACTGGAYWQGPIAEKSAQGSHHTEEGLVPKDQAFHNNGVPAFYYKIY